MLKSAGMSVRSFPLGVERAAADHAVRIGLVLAVRLDVGPELLELLGVVEVGLGEVVPRAAVVLSLKDFRVDVLVLFLDVVHASIIRKAGTRFARAAAK